MKIEQIINYNLNKYPCLKKAIKRGYQLAMYALSPKLKSEGNISRISPAEKGEYFFGYYDKSPWDATGRYILCLRAQNTWSKPDPTEEAEILIIDTQEKGTYRTVAKTTTWNVQQGCMAQWLGPDFSSKMIYNTMRDGRYCAVILDVATLQERILPLPVYTVSQDGETALSLDFSRLHNLRPGYGYAAVAEETAGISLPDSPAVWRINIRSGEVTPILSYKDFAHFSPRPEMQDTQAVHKVNHLMLSPDGRRFMVLYRWLCGRRKYTRLITCNTDGSEMYLLSDDDMVSHCYWKNNEEILAYERKKDGGLGYYLMRDRTQQYTHLWPGITNDGHPSYSPTDNTAVVIDSYPNRARIQELKIAHDNDLAGEHITTIARVFAPFRYDNDTRCDLHPRWSRDGKSICIDSVFEGHRALYRISL